MFLEMRDPAPPITEMTGEPFKSQFTAEDVRAKEWRKLNSLRISSASGTKGSQMRDALGRDTWPEACIDADGVDRGKLHDYIGRTALQLFDLNLGVQRRSAN
jgi:hypothetical protein